MTEFSKKNPFPAPIIEHRKLNGAGSEKDTRHFALSLKASGLTYEPGDALGVRPKNDPALVEELLEALDCNGDEPIPASDGETAKPIRETLISDCQITRPPKPFLDALVEKTGDPDLRRLLDPANKAQLEAYLRDREIIDLLIEHPRALFDAPEFVATLKRMLPRLYSISSSPKAHPDEVHLTVAVLTYVSNGRTRKGVCSTYLAERVGENDRVGVFTHHNKAFRLPDDPNKPIIMIGPGTGVAPFRAFLEERRANGDKGKTWLFFGDQHAKTDFLYESEFAAFKKDGVLSRLDTAFSRDQASKVYVQHRMLENAREFFEWLQSGAYLYVCGDASRMAKDVDLALREIIRIAGGKSVEESDQYVRQLATDKRYRRDVY